MQGEGRDDGRLQEPRHDDDVRHPRRAPPRTGAHRTDHLPGGRGPAARAEHRGRLGAVQEVPHRPPHVRGPHRVAGDVQGAGRQGRTGRDRAPRRDGGRTRRHRPAADGHRRGPGRPRHGRRTPRRPGRHAPHRPPRPPRPRGAGGARAHGPDHEPGGVAGLQRRAEEPDRQRCQPLPPWLLDDIDAARVATILGKLPPPLRAAYETEWRAAYEDLDIWAVKDDAELHAVKDAAGR